MKKLFFVLICIGAISAKAQTNTGMMPGPAANGNDDGHLPPWVIDANLPGGLLSQKLATANSVGNYLNGVNVNQGNLSFSNGRSVGINAQAGYFFGNKRHWGVGTGFMYLQQWGNAKLDNFHAEYQSTDAAGNVYRQVVTPDQPIKEKLSISNFNIPLLLKYKNRFSEKWGFTADAGLLLNFAMKNTYNTNASFDYEAIYKYSANPGGLPTVYDGNPTPGTTDYLITKAGFLATNKNGNVQQFFIQQAEQGYNVGLDVKPKNSKGSVSYKAGGSGGFLLQPSLNYFLSDMVALNFGIYYLYQQPAHDITGGHALTTKMGDYSSLLTNVTRSFDNSYGLNVGVRFFLGKKRMALNITQDAVDPTNCGLSDGMIILHGLRPAEKVMVNYSKNGALLPAYSSTTDNTGTIKLTELAAGTYTDIMVVDGKDKATGAQVTLVNPSMSISSVYSSNPTTPGACDGSITLTGLPQDKYVTIDYDLNGIPQSPTSEMVQMVGHDKTVTLRHLCAGMYTHIVAKMNSCIANAADVTLTAPAPPRAPSVYETIDTSILSSSIYFEPNKNTINAASRHTVDYAAQKLIEHKEAYIVVNGYADNTGNEAKNVLLSLKRAEAVKAELIRMGVDAKQIRVEGRGTNDPIGDNKTAAGRAKNRRAVLTLDIVTMEEHTR